jgi:hypothetical protein
MTNKERVDRIIKSPLTKLILTKLDQRNELEEDYKPMELEALVLTKMIEYVQKIGKYNYRFIDGNLYYDGNNGKKVCLLKRKKNE